MQSFSTEALVIKRRDYGESDRLVTFFTKKKGKITAIAKGVRKTTSRRAPNIEQLNHVKIFLHTTKGLPILTEAEAISTYENLKGSLERLSLTYLILELADQFLDEEQENQEVFDLLLKSLDSLNRCEDLEKCKALQASFQIKLLTHSGYLPQLYHCVKCSRELLPETNFLNPNLGGLVDEECSQGTLLSKPAGSDSVKVLRFLEGKPISMIEKLNLEKKTLKETVNLLNFYTTFFLEKELRSLEFASQVDKIFAAT